ncbi:hypothetical protein BDN71DRAFT_1434550 [Pleurotus eryngii]|uniref:Uncharacterized protein n=1 Tax=Pleurotus eryngii TaxID=5323 RepID=A0A9P5ZM66_PLEER|nr:hypothetical protein BDN71DRAFT_1434550 [Pleurotus eryngii]
MCGPLGMTFVRFLTFVVAGYGTVGMYEFTLIGQILMKTPNLDTLFFRRKWQMKLKELSILSEEDIPTTFSPTAFLNLRTFTFSNLNTESFTLPPHLAQLQVDLSCVRVFTHCLHRQYPQDILLSFIQPLFTNLEFLDINAQMEYIDIPSFSDVICELVHNCTLLGVRLTLLNKDVHPPNAPPPPIKIPPCCFDAMPRLRFIEFTGDGGKQQRVYRESRAAVMIRWKIAQFGVAGRLREGCCGRLADAASYAGCSYSCVVDFRGEIKELLVWGQELKAVMRKSWIGGPHGSLYRNIRGTAVAFAEHLLEDVVTNLGVNRKLEVRLEAYHVPIPKSPRYQVKRREIWKGIPGVAQKITVHTKLENNLVVQGGHSAAGVIQRASVEHAYNATVQDPQYLATRDHQLPHFVDVSCPADKLEPASTMPWSRRQAGVSQLPAIGSPACLHDLRQERVQEDQPEAKRTQSTEWLKQGDWGLCAIPSRNANGSPFRHNATTQHHHHRHPRWDCEPPADSSTEQTGHRAPTSIATLSFLLYEALAVIDKLDHGVHLLTTLLHVQCTDYHLFATTDLANPTHLLCLYHALRAPVNLVLEDVCSKVERLSLGGDEQVHAVLREACEGVHDILHDPLEEVHKLAATSKIVDLLDQSCMELLEILGRCAETVEAAGDTGMREAGDLRPRTSAGEYEVVG